MICWFAGLLFNRTDKTLGEFVLRKSLGSLGLERFVQFKSDLDMAPAIDNGIKNSIGLPCCVFTLSGVWV